MMYRRVINQISTGTVPGLVLFETQPMFQHAREVVHELMMCSGVENGGHLKKKKIMVDIAFAPYCWFLMD